MDSVRCCKNYTKTYKKYLCFGGVSYSPFFIEEWQEAKGSYCRRKTARCSLPLSVGAASRREAMPQALRCTISKNCCQQIGLGFNTPTELRLVAPTQERWSLSNLEVSNPISELPLLPPSILCLSHSPFFSILIVQKSSSCGNLRNRDLLNLIF